MGEALSVTVPGSLDGLAEAVRAADAFSRKAGVPDEVRRKLLTALDEILANVVHHGLAGSSGTIEVTLRRDGPGVVLGVSDPAGPFNPLLAPLPDTSAPLEGRRLGGLGIALVRALSDEVAYERKDGRNHLTLTWRLGS